MDLSGFFCDFLNWGSSRENELCFDSNCWIDGQEPLLLILQDMTFGSLATVCDAKDVGGGDRERE